MTVPGQDAGPEGDSQDGLRADDLDGIPPETAKRLLRGMNQSPSTWISLVEPDLTTRYIGASADRIQGQDLSGRHGKKAIDRIHPDDIEPLLHAVEQLRAARTRDPSPVPVVEPIRYRLRKLDGEGWHTVEARVINMVDDPIAQGYVLVSQLAGGELDGVDHVLDLLVNDAPLTDVLSACARLVPSYIGCGAVIGLADDGTPVIGALPDSPAEHLATDERWWRKAVAEGRDVIPLDFDEFPDDLARQGRDEGFLSAWALPLTDGRSGEVLGCLVVWVRIAVEFNIGVADGVRKAARLSRLVIGEQRTHHALEREALTDPLTGVSNRSALRKRLDQANRTVTVALVDLDDFKPVNDTYGHNVGDEVLRVVAERLLAAVREDDLVVRLGGDEFAVVFADTPQVHELQGRADRIAASLAQPIRTAETRLQITASVGMATGGPNDVLPEADRDLYKAKQHKPSADAHTPRAS